MLYMTKWRAVYNLELIKVACVSGVKGLCGMEQSGKPSRRR